jgi:hypothetical protein
MKRNAIRTIAGFAALACLPAAADVIYDNGAPDYEMAFSSSDVMFTCDDFYLAADATLGDLHWWGLYGSGAPLTETFEITIYADSSGAPGSIVHQYSGVSATRLVDAVLPYNTIYSYAADVAPLNLVGDTTYWISIYHEDVPWFWMASDSDAGNAVQYDLGRWWELDAELAFYLTSPGAVVPEPATMSLLGLGIAALGLRRARRRTGAGRRG